jgi:hypothetical protein
MASINFFFQLKTYPDLNLESLVFSDQLIKLGGVLTFMYFLVWFA